LEVLLKKKDVSISAAAFTRAFPEIEDLTIILEEPGYGKRFGSEDSLIKHTLTLKKGRPPPRLVACSDPTCYKGGFDIYGLIQSMYRSRESERRGLLICTGRMEYGRCTQQVNFKAKIKYGRVVKRSSSR